MLQYTFLVAFCYILAFTSVDSQSTCTNPRGQRGSCVPVKSCQPLLELLTKKPIPAADLEFLRNSQCQGSGFTSSNPGVCCPQASQPSIVTTPKTPQLPTRTNTLPSSEECGNSLDNRIYGGTATELEEFPWMALLEYQKPSGRGFYCGGVLISKRYILTASHCVNGKDIPKTWKLVSVRLGEYDTRTERDCIDHDGVADCADPPVNVPIEKQIPHPQYVPNDGNQYHDIALLRLARDVAFTEFISPVCLPVHALEISRNFSGDAMYVAGWGKTETKSESDIKLKLKVEGKTNQQCAPVYRSARVEIGSGQLCAGGDKGKDSCRGDSGGPLMTTQLTPGANNKWIVAGIVSFGPSPCGMEGWPGVYTRVTDYVKWITDNMEL